MSRLIDADALLERMREYANDDWNVSLGGVFTDAVDTCLDFVENAPTIEAVPVVQGEWIKAENTWVCSVCHKENACAYDETLCRFTDFFCPKCGAKMKGGA